MSTATLTSKGQITLPKQVRDALDLEVGDRIYFVMDAVADLQLYLSISVRLRSGRDIYRQTYKLIHLTVELRLCERLAR
jgi:AbrB family looped-hinge helix DNA binding protein